VASTVAALGAIAIAAGGLAIGYAVTREATREMSTAQTAAMATAVSQLDGEIKAARGQVQERARTLSELLNVQAAIATDLGTVANLVARGDFVARSGEVLELGRVTLDAPRQVERLNLQPSDAVSRSHAGVTGSYVELVDGRIVITEVVQVTPTEQADRLAGYLSATRTLELGPVLQPLVEAGITGKLVVHGSEAAIGVAPAGAVTHAQPLASQAGASLVVAEPPARAVMPLPILVGGVGAAVIGLLLLAIGLQGKRAGADPRREFNALPTQPTQPPASAIGDAQTQLSAHGIGALPTPSPLDPAGSAQLDSANVVAGSMIGRWQVVRRLGSGGMADVYLAQAKGDGGFEKLVAIKIMHGHLARNQRAVDLFLDEARLAARIQHPNVVAIQDLGKIGDDYVIVMEYVEGVDLERLLTCARAGQRPVPLAVGLGLLSRICDGLDAAHHATSPDGTPLGIVHRDVKSANVLVSRQGIVKVVDFGIAKAAKQVHYTVAGETKGTPSMMAPEQRVGEQVDVRADVYSVAAVGYEILTGHTVNLDLAALAHLGVENWPHLPLPSSLRADLPPELDELLLTAMAFDRERRPASCAAFEARFEVVIKAHGLATSDKEIARWVVSELRHLAPAFGGLTDSVLRSPPA
jgi:hypothetical protein